MKIRQPQTKRKTLKLKYKIIKKVAQHRRRLRKEARKAEKAGLVRHKTKKDPGIPNNWPYKQEELLALQKREQKREKDLAQRKKHAHDKVQAERKQTVKDQKEAKAEKAQMKLEKKIVAREEAEKVVLKKLFSKADVLLEVVDARDPISCRSISTEHRMLAKGKRVVILLNKIEAVPKRAIAAWLRYFADTGCLALAYEKTGGAGAALVVRLLQAIGAATASDKSSAYTFGVFGPKGVAKRVILEGLRKHGVSRHGGSGEFYLLPLKGEGVPLVLVDRAGRLEKGSSMTNGMDAVSEQAHKTCELLRGAVNLSQMESPKEAVGSLLSRAPKESVMRSFALPAYEDTDSFLTSLGKDRGWKSKRGKPLESERLAIKFLTELSDHTKSFHYVCAPPTAEGALALEKSHWAKAPGGPSLLTHVAVRPILEEQHGAFSSAVEAPSPSYLEMMSIAPNFDFPAMEKGAEESSEDEEDDMEDEDEDEGQSSDDEGDDDEDDEDMSDDEEEDEDDEESEEDE